MFTLFSLIWSQIQFLVIIDYSLGKKHVESMQWPNRNENCQVTDTVVEPRNTCTIRQRVYNYPIAPYIVHKSVEFSGVGSLTH